MAFITDGYQTLIYFEILGALNPGGAAQIFRERTVKPPELDSNGTLDTTTMRNIFFRSFQPKRLLGNITPMGCEIQYDPAMFGLAFIILLNTVNFIIIQFPDGSQIKFYGWIGKFVCKPLKEGEFATADLEVFNSYQDQFGANQVLTYAGPNAQFMVMPGAQAAYET